MAMSSFNLIAFFHSRSAVNSVGAKTHPDLIHRQVKFNYFVVVKIAIFKSLLDKSRQRKESVKAVRKEFNQSKEEEEEEVE